jgi:biopolymer transport protein ExbD
MKIHAYSPDASDVRIELIPLIDVIFCILTFFILAAVTLTRQTAINVDLPGASTGATQMREMLIVSINPIGQIYIEQEEVSRQELYQQLQTYHEARPQGLVVLYADRLASYSEVVEVLDILRSVGGDRVALATAPGAELQFPQSPTDPTLDDLLTPADPFDLNNPGLNNPGLNQNNFNDPLAPDSLLTPDLELLPDPNFGEPSPAPTNP